MQPISRKGRRTLRFGFQPETLCMVTEALLILCSAILETGKVATSLRGTGPLRDFLPRSWLDEIFYIRVDVLSNKGSELGSVEYELLEFGVQDDLNRAI